MSHGTIMVWFYLQPPWTLLIKQGNQILSCSHVDLLFDSLVCSLDYCYWDNIYFLIFDTLGIYEKKISARKNVCWSTPLDQSLSEHKKSIFTHYLMHPFTLILPFNRSKCLIEIWTLILCLQSNLAKSDRQRRNMCGDCC